MTAPPRIPKAAWWWLAAIVAAWFVQRGLNKLADGKGARQRYIESELQPFGLN